MQPEAQSPQQQQMLVPDNASKQSPRIPWLTYYFLTGTTIDQSVNPDYPVGLVLCPVCSHHFPNDRIARHLIAHLYMDELFSGTLWSFDFCPDCLFFHESCSLQSHRELHSHVSNPIDFHSPLRKQYVCPSCELPFSSILKFAIHLYERHVFRDAAYVCTLCYSFRTSRHVELMNHLRQGHTLTNQVQCPYCLRHFELPDSEKSRCQFSAYHFYDHMRSHWEDVTYRCDGCRLEFLHRRDLLLHDYLHHSGHHHPAVDHAQSDSTDADLPSPDNQLLLSYSQELRTTAPRVGLKCLECGELLRHPISRHFNLTVICPSCPFRSSCSLTVHWHWCRVHSAPSLPSASSSSSDLTSWERCISSLVGYLKFGSYIQNFPPQTHDPCGALYSRMRRCKHKHSPPGLEYRGILQCPCGFRTLLGNQMAKHLASSGCGSLSVYMDRRPRIPLFPIVRRSVKTLNHVRQRTLSRLCRSPLPLKSVGLCRRDR